MYKILIIILFISTLCILGINPKMHKKVFIYDSSYSIVEEDNQEPEKIEALPIKEQKVEVKKVDKIEQNVVVQKNNIPKIDTITVKNEKQSPQRIIRQEIQPKNISKKETVNVEKKPPQHVKKDTQKVIINKPKQEIKEQPKIAVKNVTVKQEPKVLTQKEEEIAWNIWRSNLQNQIMKDTKLPYVPKGTIFKFSFDVDKYGRISSVKTWSLNSNYTPIAIQFIAPVIRSYQGKDILDFPNGTQRFSTKFEGGWKISDNAKYSTPNDYNDIEKVKK